MKGEEKYRDILANISYGVYWLNSDGYFTFVNKAIIDRTGIPLEKFYTLHFLDLIDSYYHDQAKKDFQMVMKGGEGIPYELKYRDAHGKISIVEVHSKPIHREGHVVGLLGVARNITEHKQAEELLLQSEARYRSVVEDQEEMVCRFLPDSTLTFVNDAYCRYYGKSRGELLGKKFMPLITDEDREMVVKGIASISPEKPIERHDQRSFTASGEVRWQQWVNRAFFDEQGQLIELQAVGHDITDLKLAEEALRTSEHKYRILIENASDAILLADEQGNLIESNRMAENLLGYPREKLLQMHYTQLHPMIELEKTIAAFKDIVTHSYGGLQNGAILRKDGTIVPVDITATVIEYNGKKVLQASFRDVSEHKRTEDTLEGLVRERTAELSQKNKQLAEEIKERKRADAALRKKKNELMLQAGKLQEMNAALKVLLKQREDDKNDIEEKVISNVKELLLPYIEEMKTRKIDPKSKVFLSIIETNLQNIISPFTQRLSSKYLGLTPGRCRWPISSVRGRIQRRSPDSWAYPQVP